MSQQAIKAVAGRLKGKHVVVTGAGTGIGQAIAQRLWAEGAKLTLLARSKKPLAETEKLCARMRATSKETFGVSTCDIRERSKLNSAFASAVKARGPLYALIANAGVGGANVDGPNDRFDEIVSTNLNGTYNSFRAAEILLAPKADGARHLVAISSILARIGVPAYTGYCASKSALLGLVRALAMELAQDEVQVNAICPGWVDTQMAREGIEGMSKAMDKTYDEAYTIAMSAVPLGRMSAPEDVAGMVAWLISPDARGVTGQALDINGGAFM